MTQQQEQADLNIEEHPGSAKKMKKRKKKKQKEEDQLLDACIAENQLW